MSASDGKVDDIESDQSLNAFDCCLYTAAERKTIPYLIDWWIRQRLFAD